MAKRTLYLEPEFDYDFELISIVSPVRDYRLCWHLHQLLSLDFVRQDEIVLHYPKKHKYGYYNLFYYEDELNWLQYYFINNRSLGENLIPELKQVDYFLLIKGGNADVERDTAINALKQLEQVQAVLSTDPEGLKSKQNLIFE